MSRRRDVHSCTVPILYSEYRTHWLKPRKAATRPIPRIWTRNTRALLVSHDRGHLLVPSWLELSELHKKYGAGTSIRYLLY
jgi:hypothetical protein